MSEKFDILKAELIWLGDLCYRKMPISQPKVNVEEDLYPMDRVEAFGDDDDYSDISIEFNPDNNEYSANLSVPQVFFGDGMKKRIMKDTDTYICYPPRVRQGDTLNLTIVSKRREKYVCKAYRRIQIIVDSARLRADSTHFISVPMNFDILQRRFLEFKASILKNYSQVCGIDEDIFQNPKKLHLTVAMLVLCVDVERQKAASLLQGCKKTVKDLLRDKPLTLKVKGIEYMNDDTSEVDVLYAKVQDIEDSHVNFKLQMIADTILKIFQENHLVTVGRGSVKCDLSSVKLHITLMNTIFRHNLDERCSGKWRESFDATEILKNYSDYDFGTVTVNEIHLSIRFTSDDKTGYYKAASVLKL